MGPKGDITKKLKEKFQGTYFNYNKFGYHVFKCKKPMNHRIHAHMIEVVTGGVSGINLSVMVSKVNMVGSNP